MFETTTVLLSYHHRAKFIWVQLGTAVARRLVFALVELDRFHFDNIVFGGINNAGSRLDGARITSCT